MRKDRVLVLRTCDANLQAHKGFQWPESGPVKCLDWNPEPICGGGLHGLLWGCGDGGLLDWNDNAKWLVVEVAAKDIAPIGDGEKVKFPRGKVVHCGDRKSATDYLDAHGCADKPVVGGFRRGGDGATLTGGYRATLTGGKYAVLTGGDYATLTGGKYAVLTGGDGATLTGGYRATLSSTWWDGKRPRIATAYVGEDGIKPNTPYRVEGGKFVEVTR